MKEPAFLAGEFVLFITFILYVTHRIHGLSLLVGFVAAVGAYYIVAYGKR